MLAVRISYSYYNLVYHFHRLFSKMTENSHLQRQSQDSHSFAGKLNWSLISQCGVVHLKRLDFQGGPGLLALGLASLVPGWLQPLPALAQGGRWRCPEGHTVGGELIEKWELRMGDAK